MAERVQPVAQFLAAFPANLLFPVAVSAIVALRPQPEHLAAPLMILGTQWYILFNVIAGASACRPTEQAAAIFGVRGWQWWRTVDRCPAILPYFVTGAITASGGSWNAASCPRWSTWGDTTLRAAGLGAYIADATATGDYPRIVLGIAVMCVFVVAPQPPGLAPALRARRAPLPVRLREDQPCPRPLTPRRLLQVEDVRMCLQPDGKGPLVLDGVDVSIQEGEIVSLLGRSGSGKSTLLRIIAGLLKPTDGRARVAASRSTGPLPASPWCSRASRCSRG